MGRCFNLTLQIVPRRVVFSARHSQGWIGSRRVRASPVPGNRNVMQPSRDYSSVRPVWRLAIPLRQRRFRQSGAHRCPLRGLWPPRVEGPSQPQRFSAGGTRTLPLWHRAHLFGGEWARVAAWFFFRGKEFRFHTLDVGKARCSVAHHRLNPRGRRPSFFSLSGR